MDFTDKDIERIPNRYRNDRENDDLCTRFIRKKFKCIVIFLLFSIAFFEFLNNIITRLDEDMIKKFISSITSHKNESLTI
jgi:hypothetical protein